MKTKPFVKGIWIYFLQYYVEAIFLKLWTIFITVIWGKGTVPFLWQTFLDQNKKYCESYILDHREAMAYQITLQLRRFVFKQLLLSKQVQLLCVGNSGYEFVKYLEWLILYYSVQYN